MGDLDEVMELGKKLNFNPMEQKKYKVHLDNIRYIDEELAIKETMRFKLAGGSTIVEMTNVAGSVLVLALQTEIGFIVVKADLPPGFFGMAVVAGFAEITVVRFLVAVAVTDSIAGLSSVTPLSIVTEAVRGYVVA